MTIDPMPAPTPAPTQTNPAEIARYVLERQLKGSASWFYWIAALSAINWVASLFSVGYSFVVGLGVTQLIDGMAQGLIQELGSQTRTTLTIISFVAMLGFAGLYALFGFMGSRRASWAFVVGSILYILDAVIFIWARDFLPLVFHALALFSLLRGPGIIKKIKQLEEHQTVPAAIQPLN